MRKVNAGEVVRSTCFCVWGDNNFDAVVFVQKPHSVFPLYFLVTLLYLDVARAQNR